MEAEAQNRRRLILAALLALIALSLAARLWLFFTRPLWFDEIFTVWAARLSPEKLLDVLRQDSGPPAFYLFEKPFVLAGERFFGSDLLSRVLPFGSALLLFGGALVLPHGAARRFYLLLAAGSPLLNLYAAEARAYTLLSVFSLLLFRLALQGAENIRRGIALSALGALCLYTHYLGLFVLAGLIALTLLRGRVRSLLALLASVALFLPWLPVLRAQPSSALSWMRESLGGSITGFLATLGGLGRIPDPFGPPLPNVFFSVAIGLGAFLLLALSSAARRDRGVCEALLFVAFVLSGVLLVSLWRPIAFAGRTEMAVLPVWLAAVARGAGGSAAVRWGGFLSASLGFSATVMVAASAHPPFPPAELTARLSPLLRREDALFAGHSAYLPARLAAERGELAGKVRAFPQPLEEHPGWFLPLPPSEDDYRALERALEDARAGERIFFLLHDAYAAGRLRQMLAQRGKQQELWRIQEFSVLAWTP